MSSISGSNVGTVKSVQRGSITIANPATSNNAIVTAVVVNKCQLVFAGSSNTNNLNTTMGVLSLTNPTTVTLTNGTITAGSSVTVGFTLTEYW